MIFFKIKTKIKNEETFFLHVIHVLKTKMIHIGYFIYNYFHNFMIKIKFN